MKIGATEDLTGAQAEAAEEDSEEAAISVQRKCTKQPAQNADKNAKSRSNQERMQTAIRDQYTAKNATGKGKATDSKR